MSGFSADWLALRAPADDRARSRALERRLARWIGGRAIRIADLGGGAGAATRALGPLAPAARWRVLDDDPALLALAARAPGVETVKVDLARDLGRAFDPRPDLVTAFAFLDLCGAAWLDALAGRLAAAGAAFYAPLSYDGEEAWRPIPEGEAAGLAAFHADMARDKGLGPALGPAAAAHMARALARLGYDVATAPSPWLLAPGPLLDALATGGAAAAATRLGPAAARSWAAARRRAAAARIGHVDLLALPRASGP